MATGRVIIWREGANSRPHFGFITDDAFGDQGPRESNVYFDERDIDCDRFEILRFGRVSFEYQPNDRDDTPRARHVRPIPERTELGTVKRLQSRGDGFYGFIKPNDGLSDFYFDDRKLVGDLVKVGDRVRFVVDQNSDRRRASRVEIEGD